MDGGPADVLLRIYTSAGKLVRELRAGGIEGQLQLTWDGLDAEGAGLANGVYVFKLQARAAGVSGSAADNQKSSRQGRFVIVNP
jgi:flagellar hook assembly protein FlgD